MPDYDKMTCVEFDSILSEIICEMTPEQILCIPGIYEVLSEHFNNDVLDRWVQRQETEAAEES